MQSCVCVCVCVVTWCSSLVAKTSERVRARIQIRIFARDSSVSNSGVLTYAQCKANILIGIISLLFSVQTVL